MAARRARSPIAAILPGDLVLVRAGERVAVDGVVEEGRSEVDQSLVTGETAAVPVAAGANVYAGTMNMTGALRVRVRSAATGTLLDEVNALLERAIEQRSSYVKLADRAARLYAPIVHLTALATFLGWIALRPWLARRARHRDHRAHHHLPLRARARGAGGAGGRGERDVPSRPDAEFRRCAGTPRRHRYGCVRQDGHADVAEADPRQQGRDRAGGSGACRLARAREQTSARQSGRRRGGREDAACRP